MFTALLVANAMSWALLGVVVRADRGSRERHPEVALGRRAWQANRTLAREASALGPLFRPIARHTRTCLSGVSRLEQDVRRRAARRALHTRLQSSLRELAGYEDPAVLRMRHVVEQLEETAVRLARYRAGLGALRDLEVPLACLRAELAA
jgi:hypothetical protein